MPKKTTMSCCVPIVCVRMAVLYHAVHHVSREKLDRPVWVIWPRVCRQGYTNPLRSCQGAARALCQGRVAQAGPTRAQCCPDTPVLGRTLCHVEVHDARSDNPRR